MDDNTFDAKRRNLLAITVVLFFLKFADASISPTASVSSLSIVVQRPEAIFQVLWMMWLYFYLRAYQHFHFHLKLPYKRSIQKTLIPILHPQAAKVGVSDEFEREFYEDLERFYKYDLRFNTKVFLRSLAKVFRSLPNICLRFLLRFLQRLLWAIWAIRPLTAHPTNFSNRTHINFIRLRTFTQVPVYTWTIILWTIMTPPRDAPGKMHVRLLGSIDLGFWPGIRLYIRLAAALTITSTPFFDYRLPFLLALVPVPYYLFA